MDKKTKETMFSQNIFAKRHSLILGVAAIIIAAAFPVLIGAREIAVETTYHFVTVVCPSYTNISGNSDANKLDATGGNYAQFANHQDGDVFSPLPTEPVSPAEIPAACTRVSGWSFQLSSDENQTQDVATAGPTDADGEYAIKQSDLNPGLQNNVLRGGKIWVSEITQPSAQFGALRCYKDAVNGDNSEFINLDSDRTIYCIVYNVQKPECAQDSDCADGKFCNGAETCVSGHCVAGSAVDCSTNNIPAIGSCSNDADNNPLTWDSRDQFTSVCSEETKACTAGNSSITHTCSADCQAACTKDSDCNDDNEATNDTCDLATCQCQHSAISPDVKKADVALTKTVDLASIQSGNDSTFTITVANNGPDASGSVVVSDALPAGLTFVSDIISAGAYNTTTDQWTLSSLANGEKETLNIVAVVNGAAGTSIVNTATVKSDPAVSTDDNPGNDSASVTVTIADPSNRSGEGNVPVVSSGRSNSSSGQFMPGFGHGGIAPQVLGASINLDDIATAIARIKAAIDALASQIRNMRVLGAATMVSTGVFDN